MRYVVLFIIFILLIAGLLFLAFNYLGLGQVGDDNPTPPANPPTVTPPTTTPPGTTPPGQTPGTPPTSGKTDAERLVDSVDKKSGNYSTGQTLEIEIKATPPNTSSNKTKLRLKASGMQIIGYTAPTDSTWTSITTGNECSTRYSSTDVCVDLTKEPGRSIVYGESLGKVRVRFTTRGQGILSFTTENGYYTGDNFTSLSGTLSVFGITGNSLPSTAIISDQADLVFAGLFVMVLAIVLYRSGIVQRATINLIGASGFGLNTFNSEQSGVRGFLNSLGLRRVRSLHRRRIESDQD
jgi:hypothetical protein